MPFFYIAVVLRRKNKGRTRGKKTAVLLDFFLLASKISTGNDHKIFDNSVRISMSTIKIRPIIQK